MHNCIVLYTFCTPIFHSFLAHTKDAKNLPNCSSYFSAYENGISSKDGTNFFEYDIALILIKGSSFDEKFNHQIGTVIKPICLIGSKKSKINEINELSLDQEITIVGMGWVKDKKKYGEEAHPLKLQYTKVKKIPVKKCFQEVYPRLGKKSKFPKDFLGIHINHTGPTKIHFLQNMIAFLKKIIQIGRLRLI